MRRDELIEGTKQLANLVSVTGLMDFVDAFDRERIRSEDGANRAAQLLPIYRKVMRMLEDFSPPTRQLLTILGLERLADEAFWLQLAEGELAPPEFWTIQRQLHFAKENLPRIVEMLTPEALKAFTKLEGKTDSAYSARSILRVLVIEEEGQRSSPARLAKVLGAVDELYSACADLQGHAPNDLAVVACDSGSDKSFDFLGLAQTIEAVKEIILSLWDRVVFYRERQFSQKLDLIASSLPILEELAKLRDSGAIEPERAELVKRRVVDGVTAFIESGSTLPELEGRLSYSPRALLAPPQKMLASINPPSTSSGPSEESSTEESSTSETFEEQRLTDAERETLITLLKKGSLPSK